MKKIHVAASREYDVLIERGILDAAGEETARCAPRARLAAVIAGERVFSIYGARLRAALERVGLEPAVFTYPGGEGCKTLETYEEILNFLAQRRFGRSDAVVALGGGVTGDMAGFAAATYQRGTALVQIPTTLLAMVDSSVGGKTAVNLGSGKNQVGCFYQPYAVLCDPDTLDTLPEAEYKNGCAEVIKYGVLGSEGFFEELKATPAAGQAEHVIETCVTMKRDIVAADEFDTGKRMLLNLGHTVGHAVEKCSGYGISHGCAVAIGMAVIARAAAKRGICTADTAARITDILKAYGLPVETEFTAEALYGAMLADKKISGASVRLIVPEGIGRCRIETVPAAEMREWLRDGGIA